MELRLILAVASVAGKHHTHALAAAVKSRHIESIICFAIDSDAVCLICFSAVYDGVYYLVGGLRTENALSRILIAQRGCPSGIAIEQGHIRSAALYKTVDDIHILRYIVIALKEYLSLQTVITGV